MRTLWEIISLLNYIIMEHTEKIMTLMQFSGRLQNMSVKEPVMAQSRTIPWRLIWLMLGIFVRSGTDECNWKRGPTSSRETQCISPVAPGKHPHPHSLWSGPTWDAWPGWKQPTLMPTGHGLWTTALPHPLCCLEETKIITLSQGWGWVHLNLCVFAQGFEDGKCYLSVKYYYLLWF